ncbi:MAG: AAA family ATPase [Deltaproteobacteria bacterium]|nr:AAA family ATPase [Deltaproteobacteria bacterium]MBW2395266.1 AAA family ATPase [Deltaproteobacteria bacterium]
MKGDAFHLDQLAEGLARSQAYADLEGAGDEVKWIQTHLSHVFLTGDRVAKLRKAVDLGFVDFSERAARNRDCLRELEVNRRLSPDVYLGIAPVLEGPEGVRLGALGAGVLDADAEHVVVMRRLRAERDALSFLGRGELTPAHLDAVARRIARFHESHGLGTPAPWPAAAWQERVAAPMQDNLVILKERLGESATKRLREATEAALVSCAPALERRRREGRAVDGHGDLHLEHVWFERGPSDPRVIDGLEFSDELRCIDAASEVAFLAMDLHYRGQPGLAEGFLARYAERADDFGLYDVVDLFMAYRAAVRGKVAAIVAGDAGLPDARRRDAGESAKRHVALAEGLLGPPPKAPLLVLCGTVGSGKSSVARELAEMLGGVVVTTDRVRKASKGFSRRAPRGGTGPDQGLYTPARRRAVYRALFERAASPLRAGRPTLLDATFATQRQRLAARALAARWEAPVYLVEARAGHNVALQRLARRRRGGKGPSDAGPELLSHSMRAFQAPSEWPWAQHLVVCTDRPNWRRELIAHAQGVLRFWMDRNQGDRNVETQ